MSEIEYACRWTVWDHDGHERRHRVRYELTGSGDEGRRAAEHLARQTKAWQPHEGLPADATPVFRPIGDWKPVREAHEVPDATETDTWVTLAHQAAWLDRCNGTGDHEVAMRLLAIVEEIGEVARAYRGAMGQNPRKGVTHTTEDVADELKDVATSALVALHRFTDDPQAAFETKLARIAARSRATEVRDAR